MGLMVNRQSRDKIPISLTKDEIQMYIKRFQVIDKDNKGYVSINDIRRSLKVSLVPILALYKWFWIPFGTIASNFLHILDNHNPHPNCSLICLNRL